MPISIAEFLNRIAKSESSLYLMVCTDIIVYDGITRIVYIPEATHYNTNLNPMGDFRTHLGHSLLWSRHVELDCSSEELNMALYASGYQISPYGSTNDYSIYTLAKTAAAGAVR